MPFNTTPLNDGNKIPQIAFGTGTVWKRTDVSEYVEQALECGFWHIDTAAIYETEESVGTAIRQSGLKREELYITTKYDGGNIREAINKSLKKLGLTYVDLYLIHSPNSVGNVDLGTAWKEFEKIKTDGLAKSIGVSNFTVQHLQTLLKMAKVVPAVNQVQFHPYNYAQNSSLLEFSKKHGIVTEGYSALIPITKAPGGPVDKPVQRAATRLGASPAQVLLAWVKSKGVVIVTTSSKKEHLKAYLQVADLPALTTKEIADIESAGAKGPSNLFAQVLRERIVPIVILALVGLSVHMWVRVM